MIELPHHVGNNWIIYQGLPLVVVVPTRPPPLEKRHGHTSFSSPGRLDVLIKPDSYILCVQSFACLCNSVLRAANRAKPRVIHDNVLLPYLPSCAPYRWPVCWQGLYYNPPESARSWVRPARQPSLHGYAVVEEPVIRLRGGRSTLAADDRDPRF